MKTTVITYVTLLLLLASLPGLAQFGQKPKAPVLPFRIDNTNSLNLLISSAGKPVVPTASLSITAEIRLFDAASDTVRTVKLTSPANNTIAVSGILPKLEPGRYSINLLFHYTDGQGDYRSGICYIDMMPPGSIVATPDANGLIVTLNQTTQVLEVKLDASPTAAVAKSYADRARTDALFVQQAATTVGTSTSQTAADRIAAEQAKLAAQTSQTLAAGSAAQANTYATSAGQSAASASASEANALTYRNTAQSAATSAGNSATTATGAATTATAQAGIATTKAGEAATSASNALSSSQAATTARTGAESARDAAASSATAANTSAGQAGTAKTAAEAARDLALGYRGDAQTAAGTATTQAGIATAAAGQTASKLDITTYIANRTTDQQATANAQNTANQAQTAKTGFAPLGDWNPTTNTPTLSSDASAAPTGAFYQINVSGTTSFTGVNFTTSTVWSPGDQIAKTTNNKWMRLLNGVNDGGVTTGKLADKSVTPYKLTILTPAGPNLYDKDDLGNRDGVFVDQNDGFEKDFATNYTASHFIPVTPALRYSWSESMQFAWFNSAKQRVGGGNSNTDMAPANAAFLRVNPLTANKATYMVVQGSVLPSTYQKFRFRMYDIAVNKLAENTVDLDQIVFKRTGPNLFNKDEQANRPGYYVFASDGTNQNFATNYTASHFIPVTPGLPFRWSESMEYAFYDNNVVFIPNSGGNSNNAIAPANAAFLRVSPLTANIANYMVVQGTVLPSTYQPYYQKLQGSTGTLIAPSYVPGDVMAVAMDTYQETMGLAVAPKLYTVPGREVAIYSETIHKNFLAYRDKTEVIIPGGKTTGRGGKITPGSVGTITGTVNVYGKSFELLSSKTTSIVVSSTAVTNAQKILNLGDSYTFLGLFVNGLIAGAGNVTFLGTRTMTNSTGGVLGEGRGGWDMGSYTSHSQNLYNPFMQPVAVGFYMGNTAYWITALNTPDGNTGVPPAAIAAQYNATTGYPNSPRTNDIIFDNAANAYKQWNGSAWNNIATPAFSFSFAKYRQCWNIAAPDLVHILMGKNDFAQANEATFPATYAQFKQRMDLVVASIKSDVPNVKIALGVPPSSGRQGEFGTGRTERQKRALWLQLNAMIVDYAGRESEKLYLIDYHSTTDRVNAYPSAPELPYATYTGAVRETYLLDDVHLSDWSQMQNQYYGFIQAVRNAPADWQIFILLLILLGGARRNLIRKARLI